MKTFRCLLLALLLRGALGAATPLESARRAQALLGPETWSRVIRVENTAAHGPYPATVYALVFEAAGLLWFYTATDGTQSLSLHPDRLVAEKADFTRLLREIDPGFAAYEILEGWAGTSLCPHSAGTLSRDQLPCGHGPWPPTTQASPALPNGCFVESLAALRDRVRRGEPIERARLLSCYFDTPAGRRGHTVLTFETPRGLYLLDPLRSTEPRLVPRVWADDAEALAAAALPGTKVARARWVPTTLPPPAALVAEVDPARDPAEGGAPRLMR